MTYARPSESRSSGLVSGLVFSAEIHVVAPNSTPLQQFPQMAFTPF
jgi:hypothetical protein